MNVKSVDWKVVLLKPLVNHRQLEMEAEIKG